MKCSISECSLDARETVRISFRETRRLCEKHYRLFRMKDVAHPTRFTRASEM